jgi:hypothetical protein
LGFFARRAVDLFTANKNFSVGREENLGTKWMNHQLRTVTVRITKTGDGGFRAWSDDLKELSLTCLNHQALFAELEPMVANLFKQQGFDSKIVREIHQYIVELEAI